MEQMKERNQNGVAWMLACALGTGVAATLYAIRKRKRSVDPVRDALARCESAANRLRDRFDVAIR
jgi:hypothetical protein